MKYSECNQRQKKAWKNIQNAASDYIFGLLNGCLDSDKTSQEYIDYRHELEDLESLIETVYNEGTTSIYNAGSCSFGASAESYLKDIRFCGKEFLMRVATFYCKKYQKEALSQI